jgi:hypothetical protein
LELDTPGADFDTTFCATAAEARDTIGLYGDDPLPDSTRHLYTADQMRDYARAALAAAPAARSVLPPHIRGEILRALYPAGMQVNNGKVTIARDHLAHLLTAFDGQSAMLAAAPAVAAPAEPMTVGGIPFDVTPEQFVRSLLWDDFPECCGCPTEGHPGDGYFQPPDGPQCCGCPEAVKLNDAQIVASLREQFPAVTGDQP